MDKMSPTVFREKARFKGLSRRTRMRSRNPGKGISISVENIPPFGIWIFVKGKEYFLSFEDSSTRTPGLPRDPDFNQQVDLFSLHSSGPVCSGCRHPAERRGPEP